MILISLDGNFPPNDVKTDKHTLASNLWCYVYAVYAFCI